MVRRPDIDAVDIVTPPNTHAEIAVAAAEAGKHIFCEKPFTVTVEEAERALEAVQRAGVKHMLGFNYRRVPAIGLAKQLIESGRLGKIYHFRAVYLQDWIMDPQFPRIWKLNRAIAGSGPHHELNATSSTWLCTWSARSTASWAWRRRSSRSDRPKPAPNSSRRC